MMTDTVIQMTVNTQQEQKQAPNSLAELLNEARELRDANEKLSGANALLTVIRKHHFWPAIQVKKFFKEPNLVLLHNTYKRMDVSHFQRLYDECRSVVLDTSDRTAEMVVVTVASQIPDRMVAEQYISIANEKDICDAGYEGTTITAYNYQGVWRFGTTSCPSVDSSCFKHRSKSHGQMMDEALMKLFPETANGSQARERFTTYLDTQKVWSFVLVHHENQSVMNYAFEMGEEKYAKLIHIGTRERSTMYELTLADKPLQHIGVMYAHRYENAQEAMNALAQAPVFAVLVNSWDGKRLKVSRMDMVHREETDYGHPNPWHNMLWVYMQNRPDYHIQNYINEYNPTLGIPADARGRELNPTYLIHTAICSLRDLLFDMYARTTKYYPNYGRFKMNKELDNQLPPVIRFHLAQLRHLQVQQHTHAFLTHKAVYHYLCFHQSMKNVRTLIGFVARTPTVFAQVPRTREVFEVLDKMLSFKEEEPMANTAGDDEMDMEVSS